MAEGDRTDCCGSTATPVVRTGCCGSTSTSAAHVFEDRLTLGRRRQHQVRRAVAWLSAALSVAAVALYLAGTGPLRTLAPRVAWAAAASGAPRLLRAIRDVLTGSYPTYRLLAIVAVVIVGIIGYPLVPAVAVAALLVSESLRRPVPSMPASALAALSSSEVG